MNIRTLFLIPFLLSYTFFYGQKSASGQFYHARIATGVSSIEGYAVVVAYSYEYKKHGVTFRHSQNNQTGNHKPGFIFPLYYNDRFGDFAVMYTKSFRKGIAYASVSAGPSVFRYVNKELVEPDHAHYYTRTDISHSVGMAGESTFSVLLARNFAIGLVVSGNLNFSKPVCAAAISLTFGYLRD